MFCLLLRESAESGFMGSETSETYAHLYDFVREGNSKHVSHVFKDNDLIKCSLSS